MNNFKLFKKIDPAFIIHELEQAITRGAIPPDFDSSNRSIVGKTHTFHNGYSITPHTQSGWQYLVSAYNFTRRDYRRATGENSSYLYRKKLCKHFPKTLTYLQTFAKEQKACVQRVTFATLLPEGDVLPHIDDGEYYRWRDRYHLVVQSQGSEFTSGDEKQIFREGELWWFDNKKMHSVHNLSDSPRTHLIFDLLPEDHYKKREKLLHFCYHYLFQISYNILGKEEFTKIVAKYSHIRDILFL